MIPDDCGEKYGFAIAVELAIVFFMATLDQYVAPAGHVAPPGRPKHALLMAVIMVANMVLVISFLKTIILTLLRNNSFNMQCGNKLCVKVNPAGSTKVGCTENNKCSTLSENRITWIVFILQSMMTFVIQLVYIYCVTVIPFDEIEEFERD